MKFIMQGVARYFTMPERYDTVLTMRGGTRTFTMPPVARGFIMEPENGR